MEVSYKGSWGTICDANWDLRDARVVCKMLGFDGALALPGSTMFGAGSGKILFDDVGCEGKEDTLAECYHRGLGVNNCEHVSDAGVICFTGGKVIGLHILDLKSFEFLKFVQRLLQVTGYYRSLHGASIAIHKYLGWISTHTAHLL